MPDPLSAAQVIEILGLRALVPEGGRFAETHRDEQSSAIYYLLEAGDCSTLHRLQHAEIWAYHLGAPLRMLLIDPAAGVSEPVLGPDLKAGQQPQLSVPAGVWQAAEPLGPWSLVSTFMAPPYSDAEVAFARRADFEGRYRAHADRIRRLCRA